MRVISQLRAGHDNTLLILISVELCAINIYNVLALSVTQVATAVHRIVLDALGTVLVWAAGLVICYGIGALRMNVLQRLIVS